MSKFFIIPAVEVVGLLRRLTNEYVALYDNELVINALGFRREDVLKDSKKPFYALEEKKAFELTTAIFADAVESKMKWQRSSYCNNHCLEALSRLLPGFSFSENSPHLNQSNHFFKAVIDDVLIACEKIVSMYIPESTWTIWNIYTFGNDLVLEEGNDYRVVDWTRRMGNGEWSEKGRGDFLDRNVSEINKIAADTINRDEAFKEAIVGVLSGRGLKRAADVSG